MDFNDIVGTYPYEESVEGCVAIQLYSLNEPPKSLGYVPLSQDTAATFLEWWGEDADILHPMHFERQSGDGEGVNFRLSTPKAKTTDEDGDTS